MKAYFMRMVTIPTSLTKEQVETFQKLYLERFKEEINFEEAERKGLQLVQFMATVFQLVGADFSSKVN
jgi:hypothetical protein